MCAGASTHTYRDALYVHNTLRYATKHGYKCNCWPVWMEGEGGGIEESRIELAKNDCLGGQEGKWRSECELQFFFLKYGAQM